MTCSHPEFDAVVEVHRLEDTGRFQADVRIWCRECGLPFRFKQRPPCYCRGTHKQVALDLEGIAVSVDRLELRAAIEPSGGR